MLRWMFDGLNAGIKCVFENGLVNATASSSHNLCDLFKTDSGLVTPPKELV